MPIEQRVTFLNVDLELFGDLDWRPLRRALGKKVVVLHDGAGLLALEVSKVGLDAAQTIGTFLALIADLPSPARAVWKAAELRRFDLGIQAGLNPFHNTWTLPPELLADVAACGAELGIQTS